MTLRISNTLDLPLDAVTSTIIVNNIGALRSRAPLTQGWPLRPERVFQVGAP